MKFRFRPEDFAPRFTAEGCRQAASIANSLLESAIPECLEEIERLREERNNEAWMHSMCLGIAEGIPGWETSNNASPAITAVKKLRAQLDEARELLQDWVNLTDTEMFKHPWNGRVREYLEKYK